MRLAVVGTGTIGLDHIQRIRANPQTNLCAVVDPNPALPTLAQQLGVPGYHTLEELLAQSQLDGVVLATPNALHVPQTLACLQAGVAVLVEKPVAHTVADAQRLAQVVAQTQARVLVGHHRAHSPIMAQARSWVQSGRLGRLVAVQGSALFYKPDSYYSDAPWRRQVGGGPILINLVHEIHNLRMLCGEIVAVQAMVSHAVRGFEVEDTACISFQFDSGVLGSFLLSDTTACARSWEQTSQENPAYSSYPDEDCYVLAGTQGSLAIPTMRLKSFAPGQDRSWFETMHSETQALDERLQLQDPLALQLQHFIEAVRGQAAPLVSVHDGLRNLQVVEAIAQAARTGELVTLA